MQDRIKLFENLRDSLEEDCEAVPLTPDQRAELDSRLTAYEVDKNRGRPVADVLADVRRRL